MTTTYPLRPGDATPAFVADLAQRLVRDQGIAVRVLAPHHGGAARRETVNGVEIERIQYTLDPAKQCLAYGGGIPDNLKNFPRAKWQAPGLVSAMACAVARAAADCDLIHAHWVEPGFIAWMANLLHRRPIVLTVHSLKPKFSRLCRFTLARMDRVLFNSRYTLSQARDKGYACRGEVVYQGYDSSVFGQMPRPTGLRRRLGIPDDAVIVSAVGRMITLKGLEILASSAEGILSRRTNTWLIIAGDGPNRPAIEALLPTGDVRRRIVLTGALERIDIARLLAESDLFVNPGIIDAAGRAEGLGLTTIEAMASGLAVVGSRCGGIVETIRDGETGLLVPPGDASALTAAVGRLLDDADLRRRFSAAGRAWAQSHFTWSALAEQVAGIYRTLPRRR